MFYLQNKMIFVHHGMKFVPHCMIFIPRGMIAKQICQLMSTLAFHTIYAHSSFIIDLFNVDRAMCPVYIVYVMWNQFFIIYGWRHPFLTKDYEMLHILQCTSNNLCHKDWLSQCKLLETFQYLNKIVVGFPPNTFGCNIQYLGWYSQKYLKLKVRY